MLHVPIINKLSQCTRYELTTNDCDNGGGGGGDGGIKRRTSSTSSSGGTKVINLAWDPCY